MRKVTLVVFICALAFGQMIAVAQTSNSGQKHSGDDIAPIILSGLQAYKDKGPEEAVKAWIKGSPLDGSKDALTQANGLRQIQDYYGAYQSFEIFSTRDLSSRARIFYLVLDFEKGPLFARFDVYKSDQGWILTSFNFNTKQELIFPDHP